MNKNYWRKVGNPEWGWHMLKQDLNRAFNPPSKTQPRTPLNQPEQIKEPVQEQHYSPPPNYVTNYYNYPNNNQPMKQFQYLGFWKTLFLIIILSLIVLAIYFVVFRPEVIVEMGHKIVDFFHGL